MVSEPKQSWCAPKVSESGRAREIAVMLNKLLYLHSTADYSAESNFAELIQLSHPPPKNTPNLQSINSLKVL
jgi:hypothetical protein